VDPESGPRIERSDFDAFFRLHYRGLIRYARYAGATPEEADEAVSDAMRQLPRPGVKRSLSVAQYLSYFCRVS
jgi:DNA-directed RNA polymerase specialized sigma24 family protein